MSTKRKKGKTIGICHYRVGMTDGVSLEIGKRKKIYEKMGYTVKLIAGPRSKGADFIIPELEFDRSDIVKIKKNALQGARDYKSVDDLIADIYQVGDKIEKKFMKIQEKEKFDILILHNIFSHGRHIAAARAFYNVAKNTQIKFIAINHDFYSTYLGMYIPQYKEVKQYLKKYVPPISKIIKKHIVISSPRQKLLKELIGRQAMIFPDMFEFNQPQWKKDNYNKDFLKTFKLKNNDLIILQATRIVERKAIELAIDLITELNKRKKELIGKKLWNGKVIDARSEIIFLFAGFIEPASKEYWSRLKTKMKKANIKFKLIANNIEHEREKKKGKKTFSLWDTYVYADLVTFPSIVEGWGNQFIEAVFAKKPTVVFEYPVFKADIKPEGYNIISLGSTFKKSQQGLVTISQERIKKAASETIQQLTDKNLIKILDKNWQIGKKYHGEKTMEKKLRETLK